MHERPLARSDQRLAVGTGILEQTTDANRPGHGFNDGRNKRDLRGELVSLVFGRAHSNDYRLSEQSFRVLTQTIRP